MIETRFTRAFGLTHPVLAAPMANVAGGALAAAVCSAGGLGVIGGGYCDPEWIATQVAAAGNTPVGVGFITWRLSEAPGLLERELARNPRAVFLSFGDFAAYQPVIRAAGVPLIAQVQTLADARHAVAAAADVIVAQGAEAGGHGNGRATLTLVPEVADMLVAEAPDVLLLAAGGIVDGRGLAAALTLGADGVVCGTRFWASAEALRPEGQLPQALAADGDATIRTSVGDVARGFDWPGGWALRSLRNDFVKRWSDDLPGLAEDDTARAAWISGAEAAPIVGEGIGVIHDAPPAAKILDRMSAEAAAILAGGWRKG
ncbi:nitronate monooxygenase [Pseudooceanicola sp.]|uniref:NAD(P)H-dependent flavin oxidoreductase n=1 Tax=Pseudooceanicola sp. TaxID=1914328 RepID=UPI0026093771|nr:nitronate monooxygenase [Pseudooceanicola sp.]MDF1855677.1 nitronate monooxygenase [Pseudooceanicola sp.]